MTVEQRVHRSAAVTFMWLAVTLLGIVLLSSGCALKAHAVDPERPFQYGQLQLDAATQLLVLDFNSLELDGAEHGLLIESVLEDDRKVCVEVSTVRGDHRHECIGLGQLRAWLRSGAPAPGGR